jgi:hypothetical protein
VPLPLTAHPFGLQEREDLLARTGASSDSLPVGAMVGGILGGFLLLACLATSYWVMRKRHLRPLSGKLDTEGDSAKLRSYTLPIRTTGDDMDIQKEKHVLACAVKGSGNVSCPSLHV